MSPFGGVPKKKKREKEKKKILHLFMLARQIDWARSSLLEMCHINARSPKYSQHSARRGSETRTERCLFFVSVFTEIVHRGSDFLFGLQSKPILPAMYTRKRAQTQKEHKWLNTVGEERGGKKKANQIHTEKGTARAL